MFKTVFLEQYESFDENNTAFLFVGKSYVELKKNFEPIIDG